MAKGKKTGGRRAGTPNKTNARVQAAMAVAAQKIESLLGEGAFPGKAHDFLVAVYKDPSQNIRDRIECAGKAVQFELPRLAAVTHSGPKGGPIEMLLSEIDGMTKGLDKKDGEDR